MKINLLKGRSAEDKATIALSIQSALVSTLEVPDADRYQLFNEYDVMVTEIGRANVSSAGAPPQQPRLRSRSAGR